LDKETSFLQLSDCERVESILEDGIVVGSDNFYSGYLWRARWHASSCNQCLQRHPGALYKQVSGCVVVYDSKNWLSKMAVSTTGNAACIRSKLIDVEAPVTFQFSPSVDGKSILLEFIDVGLSSVVEPDRAKEANVLEFIYH
jgi:hypothetical protein